MEPASDGEIAATLAAIGCTRRAVAQALLDELGTGGTVDRLGELGGIRLGDQVVLIDTSGHTATLDRPSAALVEAAAPVAVRALLDLEEIVEAGHLAVRCGSAEALRTVVRQALRVQPPAADLSSLRAWASAGVLPDDDPHASWLGAAIEASAHEPGAGLFDRFEVVRAAFEAAGDASAEVSVLMAAGIVARRGNDIGALLRLVGRAKELAAAGSSEADAPVVLGEALGLQMAGDPEAALTALDRIPRDRLQHDWAAQVAMMRGTNLLLLERIDEAVASLEVATELGGPWSYAVALELLATARWLRDERCAAVSDLLEAERAAEAVGAASTARSAQTQRAVYLAAMGDVEVASMVAGLLARTTVDDEAQLLGVARILLAGAAGDVRTARQLAEVFVVPSRSTRSAPWIIALRAALLPDRTEIDLEPLVVAHRSLRPPLEAGQAGATHLATGRLAPRWARRFVPAAWCEPGDAEVEISLLGGASILLDRVPVDSPAWERTRVRELCLHLALVSTSSREHVAATLWPDLPTVGAQRNLRVTLNYLSDVIDPHRSKGMTSLLLDRHGVLTFASTRRLSIDVRSLQEQVTAVRRGVDLGDDQLVLGAARRLVRLPVGDPLGGSIERPWIEQVERTLQDGITRAATDAVPVLLRTGNPDLAEQVARRGLRADPWAERLHRAIVRCRLAVDDLDGARRALREGLAALEDLGMEPEPATTDLAALVGLRI